MKTTNYFIRDNLENQLNSTDKVILQKKNKEQKQEEYIKAYQAKQINKKHTRVVRKEWLISHI